MPDRHAFHGWTILALLAVATPVIGAGSRLAMREIPVEILRYDTAPAAAGLTTDPAALGVAGVLGPPKLGAYLVRFRLQPEERIVLAKGLVRDGFAPRTRSQGTGRTAARLIGNLGYHLVLREVPGDLHQTIGPLAGLLLPGRPGWKDKGPRPARVLVLRDDIFHYHDGYAIALVMIEANALTRVAFHKVVTRLEGHRRTRARALSVLVQAGPEVNRVQMLQLMAGTSLDPSHEQRVGSRAGKAFAGRPVLPMGARSPLASRTHDRDGFGPP